MLRCALIKRDIFQTHCSSQCHANKQAISQPNLPFLFLVRLTTTCEDLEEKKYARQHQFFGINYKG